MMKSAKARNSQLILTTLILVGAIAAVLMLRGPGELGDTAHAAGVATPTGDHVDRSRLSDLQPTGAVETRSVVETAKALDQPVKPGSVAPVQLPLDTEGATRIHVQLVDEEGQPVHLAGVDITTQCWLEDTGEIYRYPLRTNDRGRASIAFGGMVHVDWFTHEPAAGSELSYLYQECHDDIEAGAEWETELTLSLGGKVHGRVLDTLGEPVSGVAVHVFRDYYPDELSGDWKPGLFQTVTDRAGTFAFESLPSNEWRMGVPPFEWLQVAPSLNDSEEGVTYFELEPGSELNVGDLVVTTLDNLDVQVIDFDGKPVEGAQLHLAPLSLDTPGFLLVEEADELESWMRGDSLSPDADAVGIPWAYGDSTGMTDADGRTRLAATSGTWRLLVHCTRNVGTKALFSEEFTVYLPREPMVVRVPASFQAISGRVLDLQDRPVAGLPVVASDTDQPNFPGIVAVTDAQGVFRFDKLPRGKPLWFHLLLAKTLPATHRAVLSEDTAEEDTAEEASDPEALHVYRVRQSATLDLAFTYIPEAMRRARVEVLALQLETLDPAPTKEERGMADRLREQPLYSRVIERQRSALHMEGLLPGTYRVRVMVPTSTGAFNQSNGAPLTEFTPWASRVFQTGESGQSFELDFSTYEFPEPEPGVTWGGRIQTVETGADVGQVWMTLKGKGWSRSLWSSRTGEFSITCPDKPFVLLLGARGYAYYAEEMATAGSLGSDVRILLESCKTSVDLRFQTRDGEPLPQTMVRVFDESGEPAHFNSGSRIWNSRGWSSRETPLIISSLRPGRYQLQPSLDGFDLAEQWVTVRDTSELQPVTVEFPYSADELREMVRKYQGE